MNIVESNDGAVKQSSSSLESQASSEVSVEQTKTGSIESSVQQASSVEQSSSSVVQSSVSSSVSSAVNAPTDSILNEDDTQNESKDEIVEEKDDEDEYEEVEVEEEEVDEDEVEESIENNVNQEQNVVVEQTPNGTITTVTTTTITSGADPSSTKSTITKTTTTKSSSTSANPTQPPSTPVTQSQQQNTTTVTQVETVTKANQPTSNTTQSTPLAPVADATLIEAPIVVSSSLQTEQLETSTNQLIESSSSTVPTTNDTKISANANESVGKVEKNEPEPSTVAPTDLDEVIESVAEETAAENVDSTVNSNASAEIKEEHIKNSLKDIISDIDKVIEEEEKPEQDQTVPSESIATTIVTSESKVSESTIIVPPKEVKVFSPLAPATDEPTPPKDNVDKENVDTTEVAHEPVEPVATQTPTPKSALSLVMNPSGQVHDMYSLQNNHGFETTENNSGMLSPNKCAELVNALHSPQGPQGKGADLFAKRRKRSEKWIVDGSGNQQTGPAYESPVNVSFEDKQPNTWKPSLAANDKNAYKTTPYYAENVAITEPIYKPLYNDAQASHGFHLAKAQPPVHQNQVPSNSLRDLAYKPSIPQGWNAPAPVFPKDLYTPPEIPLNSYVPPVPLQQPQLQSQPILDSGLNYAPYNATPSSTIYPTATPAKTYVNNVPTPTPFRRPLNTTNAFNQHQRGHPVVPAAYLNAVPAEHQSSYIQNQTVYQPSTKPAIPQYGPPKQTYAAQPNYQQGAKYNQFVGAATSLVPCPLRSSIDLNHAENYNRAARGWGQSKDYYRPITFNKPNHTVDYTDF